MPPHCSRSGGIMNKFKVELQFLDDENEILKKEIELSILTQDLIERIGSLFGKIEKMRALVNLIQNEDNLKNQIAEDEPDKVEKWKNLRVNIREAKRMYKDLCSEELYTEKIQIIKDVLTLNKIEDGRFYEEMFWKTRVDSTELQSFLTSVLMRGKKKEIMNPTLKSKPEQ